MTPRGRLQKYLTDLRTFPADAVAGWRREGWRGVGEALAPRTLHRVYRCGRFAVFAQPLEAARDLPPPAGVTITPLAEANLPALREIAPLTALERFRRLLRHGHHGLVAWRGERPIGYAWVALRMGPEVSQCALPLPADAAYLWDLYVHPAERNTGVGSALACARLRVARECGRREGWRMIERTNHASIRTLLRSAGETRMVGEMRFVKLFTRMRSRFHPIGDRPVVPV